MTLEIVDQEYYDFVVAFAKEKGIYEGEDKNVDYLKNSLDHLNRFVENKPGTQVRLMKDFAPYSFYFVWQKVDSEGRWLETIMNGGVIFHGSHDGGGNGGAPTFAVSLTPVNGWSIHT